MFSISLPKLSCYFKKASKWATESTVLIVKVEIHQIHRNLGLSQRKADSGPGVRSEVMTHPPLHFHFHIQSVPLFHTALKIQRWIKISKPWGSSQLNEEDQNITTGILSLSRWWVKREFWRNNEFIKKSSVSTYRLKVRKISVSSQRLNTKLCTIQ